MKKILSISFLALSLCTNIYASHHYIPSFEDVEGAKKKLIEAKDRYPTLNDIDIFIVGIEKGTPEALDLFIERKKKDLGGIELSEKEWLIQFHTWSENITKNLKSISEPSYGLLQGISLYYQHQREQEEKDFKENFFADPLLKKNIFITNSERKKGYNPKNVYKTPNQTNYFDENYPPIIPCIFEEDKLKSYLIGLIIKTVDPLNLLNESEKTLVRLQYQELPPKTLYEILKECYQKKKKKI